MMEPSPVLIFADDCGIASHLRQRLEQSGHTVVCILAGTAFTRKEEQVYTINPSQPSDYDRLVQELLSQHSFPTTIAHSWLVSADDGKLAGDTAIESIQDRGFYSLFFLVQALDRAFVTTPLHIGVISNALQAVTGNETLCPAKATVLALCTVISQEYPHIQCSSIDIELPQIGNWQHQKLTEQLVRELTLRPTDHVVAYRGQYRWVQTFEPFPLAHPMQPSIQLREGSVFMITGGLGDIGLVQARYLARHLKAKLVLVGRSVFPERDIWTQWLHTHDEQDLTSVRIRKIMEMEALGAEVLLCQADVARREQMQKVLRQVHERFGRLNGVIHSAGIIGGVGFHILHEANKAECEMHFQSKVYGLSILRELLQDVELDFCLLQSSLSSILGGVGYAAYAAANYFMDVVAHQQNLQSPTPWISINWDGWQATATHTNTNKHTAHVIQSTFNITHEAGEEAFARILSMEPVPQVIISTMNLPSVIERSTVVAKDQQQDPAQENALSPHSRAPQTGTYIAPRNATERTIADIWQSLPGIEPIGIHDNFFDLGGHSVIAIQVAARIREAYAIELGVHLLFENPTIAALGEIVERISSSQQAQKPILTPISRTHYRAEESSASSKQEFFKEKGQGEL